METEHVFLKSECDFLLLALKKKKIRGQQLKLADMEDVAVLGEIFLKYHRYRDDLKNDFITYYSNSILRIFTPDVLNIIL